MGRDNAHAGVLQQHKGISTRPNAPPSYSAHMAPPSYGAHVLATTGPSVCRVEREGREKDERPHPISSLNTTYGAVEEAPPSYQAHAQKNPPPKSPLPASRENKKTGSDAFFGPAKAAVQRACGRKEDAKQTMTNFNEANPVALVTRGVYHGARGDREKGANLCRQGAKNTVSICGDVVNATPVVGHAKGMIHFACRQPREGRKAIRSATRSTAGLVGATGGMVAGGAPGAVAGYVAGTNATDAFVSVADSAIHKEVRLHGNFKKIHTAAQEPSVGNCFEAGLGVALDVFGGMAVGAGMSEAMCDAGGGGGVDGMDPAGDTTGGFDTTTGPVEVSRAGTEGGGDGFAADIGGADGAGSGPVGDAGAAGKPFVGDEIKFAKGAANATREHFSGGVPEGLENMDGLLKKFGDLAPDDMKISDNPSVGMNPADRLANLEAVPLTGKNGWLRELLVPEGKRDYIQDDLARATCNVPR